MGRLILDWVRPMIRFDGGDFDGRDLDERPIFWGRNANCGDWIRLPMTSSSLKRKRHRVLADGCHECRFTERSYGRFIVDIPRLKICAVRNSSLVRFWRRPTD